MTYDTSIRNKGTSRLNVLRSLANTTFGHNKETTTTNQTIYTINYDVINYAWSLTSHHNTLQTTQNKTLKVITEWMHSNHIYRPPTPRNQSHQGQGSPWHERHTNTHCSFPKHTPLNGTPSLHTKKTYKTTPSTHYHTRIVSSLPSCSPQTRSIFTPRSPTTPSTHWRTILGC